MPVTKNCVIFIGCNFESRTSQVGLHGQKKDTASAKEGKVSLLRWEGQSEVRARIYDARSPEATKTCSRATENIVQVTHPGDMPVVVSWFKVKKL